jgi:hypothetical protein
VIQVQVSSDTVNASEVITDVINTSVNNSYVANGSDDIYTVAHKPVHAHTKTYEHTRERAPTHIHA